MWLVVISAKAPETPEHATVCQEQLELCALSDRFQQSRCARGETAGRHTPYLELTFRAYNLDLQDLNFIPAPP
jgi:hypothetical protein